MENKEKVHWSSAVTKDLMVIDTELLTSEKFLDLVSHLEKKFRINNNRFFDPIANEFLVHNGFTIEQVSLIFEGQKNVINYIKYLIENNLDILKLKHKGNKPNDRYSSE